MPDSGSPITLGWNNKLMPMCLGQEGNSGRLHKCLGDPLGSSARKDEPGYARFSGLAEIGDMLDAWGPTSILRRPQVALGSQFPRVFREMRLAAILCPNSRRQSDQKL